MIPSFSQTIENSNGPTAYFRLGAFTTLVSALLVCFFGSSLQASEKTPQQVLCEVYDRTYDGANKSIASIEAEGISDNSAPRESNRQLKILNERVQQLIVVQQMQAYGCKVPKATSSGVGYMIHAVECSTEQIKGNFNSITCDRSNWKSILDEVEHVQ